MTINGYLTLAWIEEDDPSRGFFRVKPAALLAENPQIYQSDAEYGQEGFLRIVPDKNEMSTFKSRMRTLGKMCLIDLRGHSRENDKIRQNKNFTLGADKNPYMIYSDVIRELPASIACEIISDTEIDRVRSGFVYVQKENQLSGPYKASEGQLIEGEIISTRLLSDICVLQLTDVDGNSIPYMVDTSIIDRDAPQRHMQAHTASRFQPHAVEEVPESRDATPTIEQADQSTAPQKETDMNDNGETEEYQSPVNVQRRVRDENELPYALKLLKEQMGLNPRRGRSLSEIVDEQWRIRKQEELGQTVPPSAESTPVESPAQRAVNAINDAWKYEGARAPMLQGIIENEELTKRLFEIYSPKSGAHATDARMIELESERLRLMRDVEGLQKRTREMKAEVLRELERTGEADAQSLRNSLVLLQEEIDGKREQAAELEKRRIELSDSIERVLGGDLTDRLTEMVARNRLSDILRGAVGNIDEKGAAQVEATDKVEEEPFDHDDGVLLSPDELTDRLSIGLRQGGFEMRRDDIIHILTVLSLNKPLILTGFKGGDDMYFSELIGDVLNDDNLSIEQRLNETSEMPYTPYGRSIESVLDHPQGAPIKPAYIDSGFIMIDSSAATLPCSSQALTPLDSASIDAFANSEMTAESERKYVELVNKLREFDAQISRSAYADGARYISTAESRMSGGGDMAVDYAIAYRVLPYMITCASDQLLRALPDILKDMPECAKTMRCKLPVEKWSV